MQECGNGSCYNHSGECPVLESECAWLPEHCIDAECAEHPKPLAYSMSKEGRLWVVRDSFGTWAGSAGSKRLAKSILRYLCRV